MRLVTGSLTRMDGWMDAYIPYRTVPFHSLRCSFGEVIYVDSIPDGEAGERSTFFAYNVQRDLRQTVNQDKEGITICL